MTKVNLIHNYSKLLNFYGKQNWWPINYHFKPREWEICIGAILTQNTNWKNVEKALAQLKNAKCISPQDTLYIRINCLQELIKSSGFYKQKSHRLKTLAACVISYGSFEKFKKGITREKLLALNGIGPETADSILVYVCNKPYFVIDAYTKRMCEKLNIKIKKNQKYEDYRNLFEKNIPRDTNLYKEFHALIVQWGKDKFKEL